MSNTSSKCSNKARQYWSRNNSFMSPCLTPCKLKCVTHKTLTDLTELIIPVRSVELTWTKKRYSQYSVERIFLKVGNIDISLALFYFLVQECTKNASLGRSILLIVVIIIILFKRVHVFFSSPYHFSSHLWLELPIKKQTYQFPLG